MRAHPILFSTDMVQAIIAGKKMQTRRMVKKQPNIKATHFEYSPAWKLKPWVAEFQYHDSPCWEITDNYKCPYGEPGDVLWVRETWTKGCEWDGTGAQPPLRYYYRANNDWKGLDWWHEKTDTISDSPSWKPSIHMPKAAARIWLEITDIRVVRLQDITEEDAIAEGIEGMEVAEDGHLVMKWRDYTSTDGWYYNLVESFKSLWFSINGPDSWANNPWLWVVSFKVLSTAGRPANMEDLCNQPVNSAG